MTTAPSHAFLPPRLQLPNTLLSILSPQPLPTPWPYTRDITIHHYPKCIQKWASNLNQPQPPLATRAHTPYPSNTPSPPSSVTTTQHLNPQLIPYHPFPPPFRPVSPIVYSSMQPKRIALLLLVLAVIVVMATAKKSVCLLIPLCEIPHYTRLSHLQLKKHPLLIPSTLSLSSYQSLQPRIYINQSPQLFP